MSDINYKLFRVNGGAVKAALERFQQIRTKQLEARNVVENQWGAIGRYGNQHGLVGLVFATKESAPAGWKFVTACADGFVFKPNATKEGKAIRAVLKSLKLVQSREFQAEVLGTDNWLRFTQARGIYYMFYERVGDVLVLHVPDVTGGDLGPCEPWPPPDSETVPMKTSEYWLLKEAHQEAQHAIQVSTKENRL